MSTELTIQSAVGGYPQTPIAAGSAKTTFGASDSTNGNNWRNTGRQRLHLKNTDAAAQTVTIRSVADAQGRKGDIETYQLGAAGSGDEYATFGPFPPAGWNDADGRLQIETSDDNLHVAVVESSQ